MKTSHDLLALIHSLTKAEKRYFRLFISLQGGEKIYLRLFDALLVQKEPDDTILLQKLALRDKRRLSSIKRYLTDTLLKALSHIHTEYSTHAMVRELMHRAELLYHRGLYRYGWYYAQRASDIAQRHELFSDLLQIIEFQRTLCFPVFGDKGEKYMHILAERRRNTLRQLDNLLAYKELYEEYQFILLRHGKDYPSQRIHHSLTQKGQALLSSPECALSDSAGVEYHSIVALDALHTFDFCAAAEHTASVLRLLESSPALTGRLPLRYIINLSNYIQLCSYTQKHKEYQEASKKLLGMTEDVSVANHPRLCAEIAFFKVCTAIRTFRVHGDWKDTIRQTDEWWKHLNALSPLIGEQSVLEQRYACAELLFIAGFYKECLDTTALVEESLSGGWRQDIRADLLILKTLTHYEMQNFGYLPYLLRSVYRSLLSLNRIGERERTIFRSLRRMSAWASPLQRQHELQRLQTTLQQIQQQENEQQSALWLQHRDIVSVWLSSRTANLPLQQVLSAQAPL